MKRKIPSLKLYSELEKPFFMTLYLTNTSKLPTIAIKQRRDFLSKMQIQIKNGNVLTILIQNSQINIRVDELILFLEKDKK